MEISQYWRCCCCQSSESQLPTGTSKEPGAEQSAAGSVGCRKSAAGGQWSSQLDKRPVTRITDSYCRKIQIYQRSSCSQVEDFMHGARRVALCCSITFNSITRDSKPLISEYLINLDCCFSGISSVSLA